MSEFDNINGIYAKDVTLREGIATLRNTVTSQTIKPLTVTQNGTYTADPSEGTYGYSPITVDVQEQPWQPLEDGYSNFWFELTNDTLSPWLNFSAKNNDAVIDWGDGSGEVALDTLTPTHTYAKAGKYVVKVKGVTEIARQHYQSNDKKYISVLKNVEHNSEITALASYVYAFLQGLENVSFCSAVSNNTYAFYMCGKLKNIYGSVYLDSLTYACFAYCFNLVSLITANGTALGNSALNSCVSLQEVIIKDTVTSIGNTAVSTCLQIVAIHIQATTPPTLGTNPFSNLPSDYIIYVPVGYGDTYKAAAGWSAYANHILEEGQTPNRAMLSKMTVKNDDNDTDNEEMR